MAVELLTKQDLNQFKQELLSEVKEILQGSSREPAKQWLKSYEVRAMLGISRGTLQTLRNNGTLNATKIGGLMFYAYEDIARLMKNGKKQPLR